jgi:hypothetical protein
MKTYCIIVAAFLVLIVILAALHKYDPPKGGWD